MIIYKEILFVANKHEEDRDEDANESEAAERNLVRFFPL